MEIRNCKFLRFFRINAIVLYPVIFYQEKVPSREIIDHEHVHLAQIKRLGVIKFYYLYFKEYVLGRISGLSHYEAYRNITFEREAFGSKCNLTEN